jgi:DNA-binding PucR family transcriptional regulator
MIVEEALKIGELKKGKIIAGSNGVHREVRNAEVLEVPEVSKWITPGVLMMTTFYSVKDDPAKQINIIENLIRKDAAGIIIKLGRFIEELPEEVIEMADEHNFPIISIPREVSYIKVLNPLYEKLYTERQKRDKIQLNPLLAIVDSALNSIEEGLNKMKDIVDCPVYIEDMEGRLLYHSNDVKSDGWRRDWTIFSQPDFSDYLKQIDSWKKDFSQNGFAVMKIPGYRNRLLIPLTSHSHSFAILHIPHTNKLKIDYSSGLHELSHKFSKLFMSDQLYQQSIRLNDKETLEKLLKELETGGLKKLINIVYFNLPTVIDGEYAFSYLIDYAIPIRNKLRSIVKQLTNLDILIFERNNRFYALVYGGTDTYSDMVNRWTEVLKEFNKNENNETLRIAISPPIKSVNDLDKAIHIVRKTLEIGMKIKAEEWVYTFDKLGIYEILINLTNDEFTLTYVNDVLAPLNNQSELLKTLEVYLNENGNISRSAELLFIHRRTLTYRLQKIEKTLNVNLDNSMTRFILQFCLLIKDLN